jgi:hypothetical protein
MKVSLMRRALADEDDIPLSLDAFKAVCSLAIQRLQKLVAAQSNSGVFGYGYHYRSGRIRREYQEMLTEISVVDSSIHDEMSRQVELLEAKLQARADAEKAAEETQQTKKTTAAAERKQQIIDAIDQASKQKGLNPLALIPCGQGYGYGVDQCKEPTIVLWVSNTPESEFVNPEHITDAYCSTHWRSHDSGGRDRPLHFADLSFLHPAVSTVCIRQVSVHKLWTRCPEQFGKIVQTAKDRVGNSIKKGALVSYDRPVGNPRVSQHTEASFARVAKIWKVGSIRVLQLRRILLDNSDNSPMRMSPRLSVKYAEKVIVLSPVPKKFRKIAKSVARPPAKRREPKTLFPFDSTWIPDDSVE